jgi:hypothetical protein
MQNMVYETHESTQAELGARPEEQAKQTIQFTYEGKHP